MDSVVKTILYCYPYLDDIASGIEEVAEYKAIISHCNACKTMEQVKKVMNLYEDAKFLRKLKKFVEKTLLTLTESERTAIQIKYFKSKKTFDGSERTFYRQAQRSFEKIVRYASSRGVSVQWFMRNCYHLHCIRNAYKNIVKREKQLEELKQKRKCENKQTLLSNRIKTKTNKLAA